MTLQLNIGMPARFIGTAPAFSLSFCSPTDALRTPSWRIPQRNDVDCPYRLHELLLSYSFDLRELNAAIEHKSTP